MSGTRLIWRTCCGWADSRRHGSPRTRSRRLANVCRFAMWLRCWASALSAFPSLPPGPVGSAWAAGRTLRWREAQWVLRAGEVVAAEVAGHGSSNAAGMAGLGRPSSWVQRRSLTLESTAWPEYSLVTPRRGRVDPYPGAAYMVKFWRGTGRNAVAVRVRCGRATGHSRSAEFGSGRRVQQQRMSVLTRQVEGRDDPRMAPSARAGRRPSCPLRERVRRLREEYWSNHELAGRTPDPAQISHYENGWIIPSTDVWIRFAETFDVLTDCLLVEGASRRPFRLPGYSLGGRLATITELITTASGCSDSSMPSSPSSVQNPRQRHQLTPA